LYQYQIGNSLFRFGIELVLESGILGRPWLKDLYARRSLLGDRYLGLEWYSTHDVGARTANLCSNAARRRWIAVSTPPLIGRFSFTAAYLHQVIPIPSNQPRDAVGTRGNGRGNNAGRSSNLIRQYCFVRSRDYAYFGMKACVIRARVHGYRASSTS